MATIQLTGLEAGTLSELDAATSNTSVVTSPVRTGTYALRCNPTLTATAAVTLAGVASGGGTNGYSVATMYHRFYFRYASGLGGKPTVGDEEIFRARATSSIKFQLRIDSNGKLVAYQQDLTSLGTGTTVLSADTWYRIEVSVGTAAAGSGVWEVKINGVSELSGSTADLLNTNNTRSQLGKATNYNGNTVDFFYDDVLLSNSAFPGAGEHKLMYPDANGNYQTWSIGAGSGSHYQVVDEIPTNDDTDYLLSSGTSGNAETQALISSATAGISGTINTAKAYNFARRNGGTNGSVKVRLRSNTTDTDNSGAFATTGAYNTVCLIADVDPATSAAWTTSGLDSAEVGLIENQTGANTSRLTVSYLMVDYTPSAGSASSSPSPSVSSSPSPSVSSSPSSSPSPSVSSSPSPSVSSSPSPSVSSSPSPSASSSPSPSVSSSPSSSPSPSVSSSPSPSVSSSPSPSTSSSPSSSPSTGSSPSSSASSSPSASPRPSVSSSVSASPSPSASSSPSPSVSSSVSSSPSPSVSSSPSSSPSPSVSSSPSPSVSSSPSPSASASPSPAQTRPAGGYSDEIIIAKYEELLPPYMRLITPALMDISDLLALVENDDLRYLFRRFGIIDLGEVED